MGCSGCTSWERQAGRSSACPGPAASRQPEGAGGREEAVRLGLAHLPRATGTRPDHGGRGQQE